MLWWCDALSVAAEDALGTAGNDLFRATLFSCYRVCIGACRLPFAMQLHAALRRCLEGSGCSHEMGEPIRNVLICLLPCLPLKAPQQRAWAAACAAETLQLCTQHCHWGMCMPDSLR